MSEFVDGLETMTFLGPSVAVFRSTNSTPTTPHYYDLAVEISKKIVRKGFGIITGGEPGIMQCANKRAQEAGGKSCGLRRHALAASALSMSYSTLTLIETGKIKFFPAYLVGKEYWSGLLDWIRKTVLANNNISQKDLDLIHVTDDPDEIADGIEKYYRKTKSLENF